MSNIPCKDCISFAICNAIVKKYELIYKTQFILNILQNRCSLINKWSYRNGPQHLSYKGLDEFIKCYNIRINIEPDYYLLKQLGKDF